MTPRQGAPDLAVPASKWMAQVAGSIGPTVSGQGWMATDSFGEAHHRVTAAAAEQISYTVDHAFR